VNARDRIRPLPTLPVEEELKPADPLRVACTDDQINRAKFPGQIRCKIRLPEAPSRQQWAAQRGVEPADHPRHLLLRTSSLPA
jgi:hypothetical protein